MTREELDAEIAEKQEDLQVFSQALDLMRTRAKRSQDESTSRLPLHAWAGATGLIDLGTVVVHNMERVLEELRAQRAAIKGPTLRVIKGEVDEQAGG
jgi:DNA-binding PucR family transcriptional regulator